MKVTQDPEDNSNSFVHLFTTSLCAITQAWPLHAVTIHGWFDLNATAMLPASLKHLDLCPHVDDIWMLVDLSIFTELRNLETLMVSLHPAELAVPPRSRFLLNGTFSCLTSLSLSPSWPFELPPGCAPATCLPRLHHAALHLLVSKLQGFADLPQLKSLSVMLIDIESRSPTDLHADVDIKCSSLRCIRLTQCTWAPVEQRLKIIVCKLDVSIHCSELPVDLITHEANP